MSRTKHSSSKKKKFTTDSVIPRQLLIGLPILFLVLGFGLGYLAFNPQSPVNASAERRQAGYQFISPLLDCADTDRSGFFGKGKTLERKVRALVSGINDVNISVFYRDLFNGPTFSLNQSERFSPASLTKVPLMMVYLKYAEDRPEILSKKLRYERSKDDESVFYQPERTLQQGELYTVEQLLYYLIVYSDNGARSTLIRDVFEHANEKNPSLAVSINSYSQLFEDLGLDNPDQESPKMTTQQISSFFRSLYNSSYLNRKYSEQALNVLSKTVFADGLRKGVESEVKVAHKFAEDFDGGYRELHDCGIVYKPGRPYILCVMTRGRSNNRQAQAISEISKVVYEAGE